MINWHGMKNISSIWSVNPTTTKELTERRPSSAFEVHGVVVTARCVLVCLLFEVIS